MKVMALALGTIAAFATQFAQAESPPVFALVMWRHGDRSPVECFPTAEVECASRWPDGFGMLTPLGMHFGMQLGELLRLRYDAIVPRNYTRTGIEVRSSDFDRTLETAESVLTGMFPPGSGPSLADGSAALTGLRLQPVPEHTVAQSQDTLLLAYSPGSCPAIAEADTAEQNADAASWNAVERRWDAIRPAVKQATGLPDDALTISNMYAVWDTITCDLAHNYVLPPGLEGNQSLLAELEQIADFTLRHIFASPQQQKLAAGRLVAEISERLQAAADNRPQPGWQPDTFPVDQRTRPEVAVGPRFWGYSAHDATIVALLQALQVYDGVHPPYASSVAVELFNVTQGQADLAMRAFYNTNHTVGGGAFTPLQQLALPCDARHDSAWLRGQQLLQAGECTVKDFVAHYSGVAMPGDTWKLACGLAQPTPGPAAPQTWTDGGVAGLGVGSAVAGLVLGGVLGAFCLPHRLGKADADSRAALLA